MYRDKRVVLIGPAPHIEEVDQREYIEGFDVVARMKPSHPSKKVKENTSDRCDVAYCIWLTPVTPELRKSKQIRVRREPEHEDTVRDKFKSTNWCWMKNESIISPWTGLCAMSDILSEEPKELYLTGFTFFVGESYYKGYQGDVFKNKPAFVTDKDRIKREPKILEGLRYFIKEIYPVVRVDKTLENIVRKKW